MKAVIIEDEAVAYRRLAKMLQAEGVEVLQHLSSIAEAIQYVDTQIAPDVFFMDIQLGDGVIFELLESRTIQTPIIFTTAYDQYAIRAFKQNSVDYLLKPIAKTDLQHALHQLQQQQQATPTIDLQAISQLLAQQSKPTYKQRIVTKVGDQLKSIALTDVTHIYSESKHTWLHDKTGRTYAINGSLGDLIQELNPKQFFQISRSCIVRIDFISKIHTLSSSRLKLVLLHCTDDNIIVAKDRVTRFKEWLDT